ncbi:MAG: hypothetical protein H7Z75_21150 [Ferruginibacter sp.]|nr:hypothetical protein [Cytophagales bacterium]
MKVKRTLFRFVCGAVLLLSACGETKQETAAEQNPPDAVAEPTAVPSALTQYGNRLRKIVKSDQGILRGIRFGDDVTRVKAVEAIEPLEDSANYLGYRVDLGNYEDLDLRYQLNDNRQVWGFTMDIYLDEQAAVDSLMADFKGYFTQRFGPSSFENQHSMAAWNVADSLKVVVKDVGVKQAPGLQVQIMNLKEAKAPRAPVEQ